MIIRGIHMNKKTLLNTFAGAIIGASTILSPFSTDAANTAKTPVNVAQQPALPVPNNCVDVADDLHPIREQTNSGLGNSVAYFTFAKNKEIVEWGKKHGVQFNGNPAQYMVVDGLLESGKALLYNQLTAISNPSKAYATVDLAATGLGHRVYCASLVDSQAQVADRQAKKDQPKPLDNLNDDVIQPTEEAPAVLPTAVSVPFGPQIPDSIRAARTAEAKLAKNLTTPQVIPMGAAATEVTSSVIVAPLAPTEPVNYYTYVIEPGNFIFESFLKSGVIPVSDVLREQHQGVVGLDHVRLVEAPYGIRVFDKKLEGDLSVFIKKYSDGTTTMTYPQVVSGQVQPHTVAIDAKKLQTIEDLVATAQINHAQTIYYFAQANTEGTHQIVDANKVYSVQFGRVDIFAQKVTEADTDSYISLDGSVAFYSEQGGKVRCITREKNGCSHANGMVLPGMVSNVTPLFQKDVTETVTRMVTTATEYAKYAPKVASTPTSLAKNSSSAVIKAEEEDSLLPPGSAYLITPKSVTAPTAHIAPLVAPKAVSAPTSATAPTEIFLPQKVTDVVTKKEFDISLVPKQNAEDEIHNAALQFERTLLANKLLSQYQGSVTAVVSSGVLDAPTDKNIKFELYAPVTKVTELPTISKDSHAFRRSEWTWFGLAGNNRTTNLELSLGKGGQESLNIDPQIDNLASLDALVKLPLQSFVTYDAKNNRAIIQDATSSGIFAIKKDGTMQYNTPATNFADVAAVLYVKGDQHMVSYFKDHYTIEPVFDDNKTLVGVEIYTDLNKAKVATAIIGGVAVVGTTAAIIFAPEAAAATAGTAAAVAVGSDTNRTGGPNKN